MWFSINAFPVFHGYFTLEAMAMGKPVLAYIRNLTSICSNPTSFCPVVQTHPSTLVADLRRLATNRDQLPELGRRGAAPTLSSIFRCWFRERLARVYRELAGESREGLKRRPVMLRFHGAERLPGPYLDHSKAAEYSGS